MRGATVPLDRVRREFSGSAAPSPASHPRGTLPHLKSGLPDFSTQDADIGQARSLWGEGSYCPASAFSRIAVSVALGAMASTAIFTWMIAGRLAAIAASSAAEKSSVRSTVKPTPPKARA